MINFFTGPGDGYKGERYLIILVIPKAANTVTISLVIRVTVGFRFGVTEPTAICMVWTAF